MIPSALGDYTRVDLLRAIEAGPEPAIGARGLSGESWLYDAGANSRDERAPASPNTCFVCLLTAPSVPIECSVDRVALARRGAAAAERQGMELCTHTTLGGPRR